MSVVVENVPLRSASSADWAAQGTILGVGELGLDTTTGTLKAGDGTSAFSALSAGSVFGVKSQGKTTLVAGTKVVNDAKVTATCIILLTTQALGTVTVPSALAVSARVAATSFTILASANNDTSIVGYQIIEP